MSLLPITLTRLLVAGVVLSGCTASGANSDGSPFARRETSEETSRTAGVQSFKEPNFPATQVNSPQRPSALSEPLKAKSRSAPRRNARVSTLPRPGTPIFGSHGFTGTVTSSHGRNAIVTPRGGGAPGILIPRSRSSGTLFLPGRPPETVIMHP